MWILDKKKGPERPPKVADGLIVGVIIGTVYGASVDL